MAKKTEKPIESVTVATISEVLEGTVIAFTAREGSVDITIKVEGKGYADFKLGEKYGLKKK